MPKRKPKAGDIVFWRVEEYPYVRAGEVESFIGKQPVVKNSPPLLITEPLAILEPEKGQLTWSELKAHTLRYNAWRKEMKRKFAGELVAFAPFAQVVPELKRLTS